MAEGARSIDMKKLLALILCGIMMLSLIACSFDFEKPDTEPTEEEPEDTEDTEEKEDDKTDESTATTQGGISSTDSTKNEESTSTTAPSSSTTTSTSGGNEDKPTTPTYTPDRTKYKAETKGSGENAVIYYATEAIMHPVLTPYYNGYKSALTMTFDDGYDLGTGTIISDQFEKYGFRGTMMLGVCFINGNEDYYINGWNDVFARGYLDLGCHGYDHLEPTTLDKSKYEHEIKDAIMYLRTKFPTQRVLTFATPYAHINDAYEDYLSQFVIGNRLEEGGQGVVLGKEFNPYRVQAISVNKNANISTVQTSITNSIKTGNWIVELYHCVLDPAHNGTDVDKDIFEYHCSWLYRKYRDDIWVASFEDVHIYAKQLEHTTVTYTDCDRESMTFTVTPDGTLDSSIYNIEMSLMVYLPNTFVKTDSAYAEINGVYQPLEVEIDHSTAYKYTVVRGIPVTKEATVKVYIGGNNVMKNLCIPHKYTVSEVVEPTHDAGGYTEYICTKCEHTYRGLYTSPVHDYTGDVVVVIEPTKNLNGLSKHYCTQCDKYEVKDNYYVE